MRQATDLGNIFNTIREVDLTPIREEAEQLTTLVILSADPELAEHLAIMLALAPRELLPQDASRRAPGPLLGSPNDAHLAAQADLLIVIVPSGMTNTTREHERVNEALAARTPVLVILEQEHEAPASADQAQWMGATVLRGSVRRSVFLERHFVPAVLGLLPNRHMSLGRHFPLLRGAVARRIISDTSVANASYSFSTGLAEIVPGLNIPLNVADMVVLTKAQAFMVYRLGLVFGLSTRWQDHLALFGGTVGTGFVWRQLARSLVGLIPVWGIVPKVAVAYAGTYALGMALLEWYNTGHDVSPDSLRKFFNEAMEQGKSLARTLVDKAPRRRLNIKLPFARKQKSRRALPPGGTKTQK